MRCVTRPGDACHLVTISGFTTVACVTRKSDGCHRPIGTSNRQCRCRESGFPPLMESQRLPRRNGGTAMHFLNRVDAGRRLAKKLGAYARRNDVLVLGIPRGGVPVAFQVADELEAPL